MDTHRPCPVCAFNALPSPQCAQDGTHIRDLLVTNDPPSGYTLPSLQHSLRSCYQHLNVLDADIEATRDALDRMIIERGQVQAAANRLKTVLHPMRSIPEDILATIFEHVVADPSVWNSLDLAWPTWVLSGTCRRWRSVMLSRPCLWSEVRLDWYGIRRVAPRSVTYRLALYLKRSKSVDLDLKIDLVNEPAQHDTLSFLLAETERWSSIRVLASIPHMASFSGCSFPRLRSLELDIEEAIDFPHEFTVDAFRFAESLTNVKLSNCLGIRLVVPWKNISSCELQDCSIIGITDLLDIEDLTIHAVNRYIHNAFFKPIPPAPIFHRLRRLTLEEHENRGNSIAHMLLEHFAFPHLESIFLDFAFCNDLRLPMPKAPLPAVTTLSLSLCGTNLQTFEVLAFFETMVNVQTLHLHQTTSNPTLLEALCVQPGNFGSSVLLPKLKTLRVNIATIQRQRRLLIDVVRSRTLGSAMAAMRGALAPPGSPMIGVGCAMLEELQITKGHLPPAEWKILCAAEKARLAEWYTGNTSAPPFRVKVLEAAKEDTVMRNVL
ncbi:hypothetical protein CYLTODRAFT_233983 [Cylindrobasidium torrendii FP15055 ss-10]|uniref:Uncharacterized protein n=1 Tax=Cylindrobasidium torrendii FP15055 ss-10 TaxID=1314674 RepID=A0A0D7BFI6_9AGAR|nr:hypothetical protein CYLTODRAFT_233983 [Cylindrobasidium torrendii FP15055 ss-10]